MKAENIHSFEDLFAYGFSSDQAIEPGFPDHTEHDIFPAEKPLNTVQPEKTAETFHPSSPANHKSVTIL